MTLIQVQLFLGHWQGLEAGREERRLFLSWSLNSAFSSWESITPYQLPVLLFLYPSPALSLLGPDEMHVSYFPQESVLQTVLSAVFGIPQSCLLDCECPNTRVTPLRRLHCTVTPSSDPWKASFLVPWNLDLSPGYPWAVWGTGSESSGRSFLCRTLLNNAHDSCQDGSQNPVTTPWIAVITVII